MGAAEAILALIQYAPQAYQEIKAVYAAVKGDLSATDQIAIDNALTQAEAADAQATTAADEALTDASTR